MTILSSYYGLMSRQESRNTLICSSTESIPHSKQVMRPESVRPPGSKWSRQFQSDMQDVATRKWNKAWKDVRHCALTQAILLCSSWKSKLGGSNSLCRKILWFACDCVTEYTVSYLRSWTCLVSTSLTWGSSASLSNIASTSHMWLLIP